MKISADRKITVQKAAAVNPNMPGKLAEKMRKQGYHFVGRHSATKICAYTSSSLKKDGTGCYKSKFYGIASHRCIQATPAIGCNLACSFCWRIIPEEEGFKWNEINAMGEWDDPGRIAEGLINEHKRIITGYKGNGGVDILRWHESNDPAHVALSLTGEPLFYPRMGELLQEFHRRGISTFLVTNGTMAGALRKLTVMPTQLYVSVQAPNREIYERITRPKTLNAWESFQEFLGVFSSMPTRRVFRLTLIKGMNMLDAQGYAGLIRKGKPHYVELKGFVFVGGARGAGRHLSYSQMPSMEEIMAFAEEVARESGYVVADYHAPSNVALLCANGNAAAERIIKFAK
jgi:tRNA wybutosine-synthesizing protein 1